MNLGVGKIKADPIERNCGFPSTMELIVYLRNAVGHPHQNISRHGSIIIIIPIMKKTVLWAHHDLKQPGVSTVELIKETKLSSGYLPSQNI